MSKIFRKIFGLSKRAKDHGDPPTAARSDGQSTPDPHSREARTLTVPSEETHGSLGDHDPAQPAVVMDVLQETKDLPLEQPTVPQYNLGDRLTMTDEVIHEGYYLQSQNGRYRFVCQGDGNLVLYGPGNTAMWASHMVGIGTPPYRIVAQSDRHFVQYDSQSTPIWRSNTATQKIGHPGTFIVLQDDGNLVMYETALVPVWHTHTGGHE